jgi:hypothetical protein
MITFPEIVYFLCFLSSGLCAYLLVAAFRRRPDRLLLWSAICFCLLAIDNLLVFVDIILLPNISLIALRIATTFIAIIVLLYGFIWEIE